MIYFAAVAEAGSIRGAARQLGLSVPVISQALSDLEGELGLTLTLPNELATHWLPPLIAAYRRAHPGVTLDIGASDRVVTLPGSRFDLAIRNQGLSWSAPPHPLRFALHCVSAEAPGQIRRDDAGVITLDLPLLTTSHGTTGVDAIERATGQRCRIGFDGTMAVDNKETARAMARRGLGAVLLLVPSVGAGLVSVLPGFDFGQAAFDLHMRDRYPSPEAHAFAALCAPPG